MITIDLNNYAERKTCGDIARELIITGSDPSTLVRFMRGSTKVFKKDLPLNFWAGTAVQESTNGEKMKHVPYRGNFQTRRPTEQPHTVGLMARDDTTYLK
mgnify:CR=1 FL=1